MENTYEIRKVAIPHARLLQIISKECNCEKELISLSTPSLSFEIHSVVR